MQGHKKTGLRGQLSVGNEMGQSQIGAQGIEPR